MKLWIDDIRPAPEGYEWGQSVEVALSKIKEGMYWHTLEVISLDHDAGVYSNQGGDYIEILNTMERWYLTSCPWFKQVPIHIHSMNSNVFLKQVVQETEQMK